MAYNEERGLIDYFGGLEDLKNKLIRAVGNPARRFTEDALRMLRAVRFAAQLGFSIEDETYRAAADLKDRLSYISAERIREELVKLLLSPHPQTGVLLADTGMMRYVLRGREIETAKEPLGTVLEYVAACPANTAMRMALFVCAVRFEENDGCGKLLRDLRFDNNTVKEVSVYVKHLREKILPERVAIKKILAAMPVSWFFNLMTLQKIIRPDEELQAIENMAKDILEKGECIYLKDLKISGADLIHAGIPASKAIGETLSYLLAEAHKNPELNQRETLLKMVNALPV
jgi:tRNA nucleotidyltransferase (CCA-adding enzyme)